MLTTNYRNHPQILDLFNREIYKGLLVAAESNSVPGRVGKTWDSFTSSRDIFEKSNVVGVRRLFISVDGIARRESNSRSWCNEHQVFVARTLLEELYAYRTEDGDRIGPKDVMIMSPYKNQRKLVTALSRPKQVFIIMGK